VHHVDGGSTSGPDGAGGDWTGDSG